MAKPILRLKGFEGEWNSCAFPDSFNFLKNNSLSRADLNTENGKVKNIHYGDVLIKYGEVLDVTKSIIPFITNSEIAKKQTKDSFLENGDIVFADAAEDNTVGKCTELQGIDESENVVSGLHTIPCRPIMSFEKGYLGYYLNSNLYHNQLLPMIQGTKVSGISKGNLTLTTISYPNKTEEQSSIATFFCSLDSMIQATTKKIASLKQIKSASLISMFPQEGEFEPRVRFKGFEGEWVKEKLCKFATRVTRKNTHLESILPLTISATEGLVSQISFFNNIVASSNVSGYYLVKNGEFAYNKSYSNGYPFGAVKRLEKYDMGVLSTLYIVFSLNDEISSDYVVHFFETTLWHNEVAIRAAEGARNHGLLNIGAEDFLDIDIVLPKDKNEQQRIASFFRSLDKQISLWEQRLKKLKQIKVACSNEMFV